MFYAKNKKYVLIILTVLWICLIFSFSLQPAEESSQLSSGFGAWLMEHVLSVFSDVFDTMSAQQLDNFHFIIRKCAHFSEFFVLGVLMYLTLGQVIVVHRAGAALGLCMLVAAMDETIQLFVAGRSGQFSDMMLDSSGSLVGICVLLVVNKFWNRGKKYEY